jgi:hypothetical protein
MLSQQARVQRGEDDGLSEEPQLTYGLCRTQQREHHYRYHGDRTWRHGGAEDRRHRSRGFEVCLSVFEITQ